MKQSMSIFACKERNGVERRILISPSINNWRYISWLVLFAGGLTCRSSDAAFYIQDTEALLPTNCNDLVATAHQYAVAFLAICTRLVHANGGQTFVNGVTGQVDSIDQFEPQYCRQGDTYAWYKMQMCCPGKFRTVSLPVRAVNIIRTGECVGNTSIQELQEFLLNV